MPRSRNIKYEFFTNDELADNDPLGRLLFIGLWTLADYKGDLVWKDRRIKAKLLPYDNCDVNKLAINLDKSGFIRFYSDGDELYVRVINFEVHQNPHKNEREKGSDIPAYTEEMRQVIDLNTLTINRDKSGLKRECSHSDPADSLSLIPDSLSLIPDSVASTNVDEIDSCFERFWLSGIKKVNKKKAKACFTKAIKSESDKKAFTLKLISDVKTRLEFNQLGFSEMHPTTYLNGERWNDDYPTNQQSHRQLSTIERSTQINRAEYERTQREIAELEAQSDYARIVGGFEH